MVKIKELEKIIEERKALGIEDNEHIIKKIETIQQLLDEIDQICEEPTKDLNQIEVPVLSFDEFKNQKGKDIEKKVISDLSSIEELPMGVYASFICTLKESNEYFLKHNYNIYVDSLNK